MVHTSCPTSFSLACPSRRCLGVNQHSPGKKKHPTPTLVAPLKGCTCFRFIANIFCPKITYLTHIPLANCHARSTRGREPSLCSPIRSREPQSTHSDWSVQGNGPCPSSLYYFTLCPCGHQKLGSIHSSIEATWTTKTKRQWLRCRYNDTSSREICCGWGGMGFDWTKRRRDGWRWRMATEYLGQGVAP